MGHNGVIVCVTVIKSDESILFHRTGSISSDKSDWLDCWLRTQPMFKFSTHHETNVCKVFGRSSRSCSK